MPTEDQDQQIAEERKAIEEAPKIPVDSLRPKANGLAGRCHWCGRMSNDLVLVESVLIRGPRDITFERYKGRDCCGGRHG